MDSTNVTTIVLAGGLSTRMGRDKALIEIAGVPLLRQIVDEVTKVTSRVLIVTAWPERYQPIVPDAQFIVDTVNQGPIVAFSQALPSVQTEWVLLLSCDLPNLSAATIQRWIAGLDNIAPPTIADLPQGHKGWEPLCGFYRTHCRESVQQFVGAGGRSLQTWLQTQVVEVLPVNDRRILFNCNTPEDLELIQSDMRSAGP
jgi:molybdenum cofactor guanylyltransferase